jgi:hypothetical protein
MVVVTGACGIAMRAARFEGAQTGAAACAALIDQLVAQLPALRQYAQTQMSAFRW